MRKRSYSCGNPWGISSEIMALQRISGMENMKKRSQKTHAKKQP
jgi:hypothetical protein